MKRSIFYCAAGRLVAFAIVLLILGFVSVKVQARQLGVIITDDNKPSLSHSPAGAIGYASSQSEVIRGDRSIGAFESRAINLIAEPLSCYSLTLSHVGSGSDPIASPIQSAGCNIGEYVADESISLSGAIADAGWEIGGWNGTINDASLADNNTLTMPANVHEAKVIYVENAGSPVILLGPPTGYESSDHTPNFDWNDVAGAELYNIQVSPREDFSILPINHFVTPSWFAPGVAMINQSYWWRVRVRVAGEWSSWSDSARMITIVGAPGQPAPVAVGPDDGASTTNRQPTFDWTDVVSAARYRIQMSYAPDFKVLIVNQLAAGSEFTPGINLTVGTYYWRVQAMGGGDVSWFTVTRSLTIE